MKSSGWSRGLLVSVVAGLTSIVGVVTVAGGAHALAQQSSPSNPMGILAPPPQQQRPAGIVPVHGHEAPSTACVNGPTVPCGLDLTYHNSPVQKSVTVKSIFWTPTGLASAFPTGYETLVNKYLTDVATDSFKTTNVYATDTQYFDNTASPAANFISYNFTYGGSIDRTDALPANHCGTPNYTLGDGTAALACIDIADIQAEIDTVAALPGMPTGANVQYLLLVPHGLADCFGATDTPSSGNCFDPQGASGFCAWHFTTPTTGTTYSNLPFIASLSTFNGCDPQSRPNGNAGDSVINPMSHEINETITDPTGPGAGNTTGGWYHSNGAGENGDNCNFVFGTLSGTSPGQFNQTINGHNYLTQEEYSNHDHDCRLTNTNSPQPTASFTSAPGAGNAVNFTATAAPGHSGDSLQEVWDFGDGLGPAGGLTPTHTYAAAGTYTVTLTVYDTQASPGFTGDQIRVQNTINVPIPQVQFSAATYSGTETGGAITITATRTGSTAAQSTVHFATSDGTAVTPEDYTANSGTLTFAAGDTSKTFAVTPADDGSGDDGGSGETVNLTLSSPDAGTTLGSQSTAVLTITDPTPPSVQFSAATYSGSEAGGAVTITVNRSGDLSGTSTVNYATSDGTATQPADYTSVSGTLTFGATVASKTFTVTPVDDGGGDDGPTRTVTLTLSSPSSGTSIGAQNPSTLNITDPVPLPTVQFSAATYSVSEPTGSIQINVTRTGDTTGTSTVTFATSDGTAVAGTDYTTNTAGLTFLPGETSHFFTVAVLDDNPADESTASQTVNLTLSSPTGATLGSPNPAVLTITEPGAIPTVQFSSGTYSVAESAGGNATITITRTGSLAAASSVHFFTTDGTAGSADYTVTNTTVNFASNDASKTVNVPIKDDGSADDGTDQTVSLGLDTPSGATVGSPSSATLTITDPVPPPTVQFSSGTYSGAENGGAITVTVTRTGSTAAQSTVNYATSNGTAGSEDYTAVSGILTFPAASSASQTFTVTPIDDGGGDDGSSETVNLALTSPAGATLGATSTALLTITDPLPPPSIQLSSATYSGSETGGPITITATRTGDTSGVSTVHYATSNGTAGSEDYTGVSGTLTFPAASSASQTFTVTPIDDGGGDDGASETVNVALTSPTNGSLGAPNTAVLTITDPAGPPTVQFGAASFSVLESAGTATITVTRTGDLAAPSSVMYATSNGTATGGFGFGGFFGSDYTPASGTLNFAGGDASKTFTVGIIDDGNTDETTNQTVNLTLSSPTGATLGSPNPVVLTIVEPGAVPPTVQFGSASYSVSESGGSALITVTRSGNTSGTSTVQFATSNGTATSPADYSSTSGTLTFTAGVTSQTFNVTINDDGAGDDGTSPTVNLTLSAPTGATLGTPNPVVLTITDPTPPPPPTVQFGSASYSVSELAGTVTITVTRAGDTSGVSTVHFATSDATATAPADYTPLSGNLTFTAGVTSQTFTVTINNDGVGDDGTNQTLNLTLSAPSGATLGSPNPVVLTIIDPVVPPTPTIQFGAASYSVAEAAGIATITVTRTGSTAGTASVNFATSDGTASTGGFSLGGFFGGDYSSAAGTLNFAPGDTSKTFTVQILDDGNGDEGGGETVNLTLSSPTGATLGSPNPVVLTITDP